MYIKFSSSFSKWWHEIPHWSLGQWEKEREGGKEEERERGKLDASCEKHSPWFLRYAHLP